MADSKLSALTELTTLADADEFYTVDDSDTGDPDKRTLWSTIKTAIGTYIASLTQTLTNKTIDLTDNTLQGTTAEFNAALEDGSFATLAGTETLTNKSIVATQIDSGTLPAARLGADSIDTITEIAAALKSGADGTLVTGTAGTAGNTGQWNADGDLVDGKALPTGAIVGTTDTQTLSAKTMTAVKWVKGADIASAATLVLGTDGNYFDVTGTTTITAVTVAAGTVFMLQFDGALTLTHHATNLDLPGEANITTAAGDVFIGFATGANTVQCIGYTRADGTAVVAAGGGDFADGGEAGGANRTLGNTDAFALGFLTNNLNRLNILSTGLVGIGQATPTARLHVEEATATREGVVIQTTDDSTTKSILQLNKSDGTSHYEFKSTGLSIRRRGGFGTDDLALTLNTYSGYAVSLNLVSDGSGSGFTTRGMSMIYNQGFALASQGTPAHAALRADVNKNLVQGVSTALVTTATDGFFYVQTCAGAPTGTPTAFTGKVAMVYDTTNEKLWIYNGAWVGVVLA